ncbi:MAG: ATP-binding protein [Bacteroidota bacterium]
MKIRYPFFLFLFALSLVLSLILRFSPYPLASQADELYVLNVQSQVREELAQMKEEMARVKSVLQSKPTPTFSELYLPTTHPYFVYQNDSLLVWSDFRFVPEYELLSGDYQLKLLNLKNGQYLSKRLAFVHDNNEVEIYFLLPLYLKSKVENNYLKSSFNREVLSRDNVQINEALVLNWRDIYSEDGIFLFSLDFQKASLSEQPNLTLSVLAGLLSIIFLGIYLFKRINRVGQSRNYELVFLLLTIYLISIRGMMLYFNLPFSAVEMDLFNPKYYASSEISPSLGDLLLNVLTIATLAGYLMRHYAKSKAYRLLVTLSFTWKIFVSAVIVLLSYWILYLHFYVLQSIYLHSQYTLDITQSIDFPALKVLCLLIFVINSGVYFMGSHLLGSVFIRLNPNRRQAMVLFAIGTAVYVVLFYFLNIYYHIILVLNALYFLILYFLRFPKFLYRFRYVTSIYFFVAALVCATIGAYAIYSMEQIKRLDDKRRFGTQLLPENDVFGEFLLDEATQAIQQDAFIINQLQKPFGSKEMILQKIKRYYLNSYFNKYNTEILIFNANGKNVDTLSWAAQSKPAAVANTDTTRADTLKVKNHYLEYEKRFRQVRYRTSYPDLYFIHELGGTVIKEYVHFIELRNDSSVIGHIVIDLKLKQIVPLDVYPELLVEKRFLPSPQSRSYNYAIYLAGQLLFDAGSYNYNAHLPHSVLYSPALFSEGVEWNGYQHVGVKDDNRRIVIVSAPIYPFASLMANFSFLFLMLVLIVVNFIITYSLKNRDSRTNTNFATKIQLYLNLAFFLPLFVVSIATVSIVSVAYRNNLSESFGKKAASVSQNLMPFLARYESGELDKPTLAREINQIARYSESDVNLFDLAGQLKLSSQPLIYDSGLLSPYINPETYVRIIENRDKEVMLPESVGNLRYYSTYVGVESNKKKLLGIVSIPFFESKAELDNQIIGVVSSILNIFTAIFLFFLALSYFASRILTIPLRLITRKIQKTSLNDYNEPLEWNSDDEIGLMVSEYNRMLVKLEASKSALSQSEKESAWREMAKQVAHEIKNPLTPMKLTLQHLQRTLQVDDLHIQNKTERAFGTLLEQIDNLSDIATSFSAFAKMPMPKNEVFEITSVLKSAADLYNNDEDVMLDLDIPDQKLFVIGDRQLMGGILTNLIINGIQSVPTNRTPHVIVRLSESADTRVSIEVKDNGMGIHESIQPKIFLPNFSTKYTGSGIGLALAKRGVEHAGGRIWFETEEEVGTSFFIELPLATIWKTEVDV